MKRFERKLEIGLANLRSFGKLSFTPKQLFYEFCRVNSLPIGLEPKIAAAVFGLSAIPSIFIAKQSQTKAIGLLTASAAVLGTLALFRTIPHTLKPPISWNEFENLLLIYLRNNEISELLEIENEVEFLNEFPSDLMLFGLPRILICESDEIAQMLRANDFHLETPCAVLSLRETTPLNNAFQQMLSRAETPQVFFLHDAGSQGFSLISNLRQTLELNEEIPLRSIGLRPVHARRLHLFARKTQNNFQVNLDDFAYLTDGEKRWLERGFTAEVSAISPARLQRVLRRIILGLEIPSNNWQITLPPKKLGFM